MVERRQSKKEQKEKLSEADRNELAMQRPRVPMPGTNMVPNRKGQRHGGRQKGTPNKVPNILKEAGVLAAEMAGYDGKGQGGVVGYLYRMSQRFPEAYLQFLGKLMPHQVVKAQFNFADIQTRSSEQVVSEMKRLGLPVEQLRLFELARGSSLEERGMKDVNPRPRRREPIVIEQGDEEE